MKKTKKPKIDVKKLSKEEKLALHDAIEEKKRRIREKKTAFIPHEGQLKIIQSPAQIRFAPSGNGFGKTALAVNEALWAAKGYCPVTDSTSPVPSRIIVVLDSPSKVEDVWLPEIKKWYNLKPEQLHKRGKPYVTQITFPNGSEILFMFHQQELMIFESIEADFFIYDEPPPRYIYVALFRGGRKKGRKARHLIVGTPIAAAWLRTDIYEPWARGERSDIECFKFGTELNRANLADGYIEEFARLLTEKEKRIRLHGEFFDLDGLALAHLFDRGVHLIEPFEIPNGWNCVVAIDPHPSKNHIACLLAVDRDGKLYYAKELSSGAAPAAFARELREWMRGFRVVDVICDSLGSTPGSGGDGNATFIEVMNRYGVRARATTFKDKSDEDFIQRIQQVLAIPEVEDNFGRKLPKLLIFDDNSGIVNDIENAAWQKVRGYDIVKPKLDISNKDYLATLKYALTAQIARTGIKPRTLRSKNKSPWGGSGKR